MARRNPSVLLERDEAPDWLLTPPTKTSPRRRLSQRSSSFSLSRISPGKTSNGFVCGSRAAMGRPSIGSFMVGPARRRAGTLSAWNPRRDTEIRRKFLQQCAIVFDGCVSCTMHLRPLRENTHLFVCARTGSDDRPAPDGFALLCRHLHAIGTAFVVKPDRLVNDNILWSRQPPTRGKEDRSKPPGIVQSPANSAVGLVIVPVIFDPVPGLPPLRIGFVDLCRNGDARIRAKDQPSSSPWTSEVANRMID
jgi:hypothetical protein